MATSSPSARSPAPAPAPGPSPTAAGGVFSPRHAPAPAAAPPPSPIIRRKPKILLHVRVVEAKDLIAADTNGRSDPYVVVKAGSVKPVKAKYIEKTLNPVWREDFTFEVDGDLKQPFSVECMDRDAVGKDDFLGSVSLPLSSLLQYKSSLAGWYPFVEKKSAAGSLTSENGSLYLAVVSEDNCPNTTTTGADVERRRDALLTAAIRAETAQHSSAESKQGSFRIFTASWNVGNAEPPNPEGFAPFISKGSDIYVIGCQECEYKLKPTSPKVGATQVNFESTILSYLNSGADNKTQAGAAQYGVIRNHALREMRIFAFARLELMPRIGKVEVSQEATGLGDVIGNKGGVAIVFKVDDLSLAFVNSHLAAHQGKMLARNSDVKQIINGLHFGPDKMDLNTQFHHIFWMGDLNYRIANPLQGDDEKPPAELFAEVNAIAQSGDKAKMRALFEGDGTGAKGDQLVTERKAGRVFGGWNEGEPWHFRPTFKVTKDDSKSTYHHKRSPAWCDRILWKSAPGFEAKQLAYGSCELMSTSDHKPVFATFSVPALKHTTGVDESLGQCFVSITRLRAHGIPAGDIGGTSDAFLTLHAPFFLKPIKTTTKSSTLTPDWGDELGTAGRQLPSTYNAKERLATQTIGVKLFDADATTDTLLAYAAIPLGSAAEGRPTEFSVDFTKGGLPAGVLQGTLQLSWAGRR